MKIHCLRREKLDQEHKPATSTKILSRIAAVLMFVVIFLPVAIIFCSQIVDNVKQKNVYSIVLSLVLISSVILMLNTLIRGRCWGISMMIGYILYLLMCLLFIIPIRTVYTMDEVDSISTSLIFISVFLLLFQVFYMWSLSYESCMKNLQNKYWLPIVVYVSSMVVMWAGLYYPVQGIETEVEIFFFFIFDMGVYFIIVLIVFVTYIALLFICIALTAECRTRVKENKKTTVLPIYNERHHE